MHEVVSLWRPGSVPRNCQRSCKQDFRQCITVRLQERHGISNNWQLDCLLNSLFRVGTQKQSKLRITGPLWGEWVDFTHKRPVMWKVLPWEMRGIMTSSNGNIFRVTGHLWGESSHWWIPLAKVSDMELWCFLWSVPEQTAQQTIWPVDIPYVLGIHDQDYKKYCVSIMMGEYSFKTYVSEADIWDMDNVISSHSSLGCNYFIHALDACLWRSSHQLWRYIYSGGGAIRHSCPGLTQYWQNCHCTL